MAERLQKVMAAGGVASRRASEALIRSGKVTVNGVVVQELGTRTEPTDDIRVNGQKLRPPAPQTYLALHKPSGYTSTVSDPHAVRTVMELLPQDVGRVFPAGRLDRESEGLLLLTDDGELTQRLLHPSFHLPKEYAVLVRGRITEATLRRLRAGAVIGGKQTAPIQVEAGEPPRWAAAGGPDTVWLRFVLREGRKRQIRETCAAAGVQVERLIRTRVGPIALGTLPPGKVRRLPPQEVDALRRACGLPVTVAPRSEHPEGSAKPPSAKTQGAVRGRVAGPKLKGSPRTATAGAPQPADKPRTQPRRRPAAEQGGAPAAVKRGPVPAQKGRSRTSGAAPSDAGGTRRSGKSGGPARTARTTANRVARVPEALQRAGAKPRGLRRTASE